MIVFLDSLDCDCQGSTGLGTLCEACSHNYSILGQFFPYHQELFIYFFIQVCFFLTISRIPILYVRALCVSMYLCVCTCALCVTMYSCVCTCALCVWPCTCVCAHVPMEASDRCQVSSLTALLFSFLRQGPSPNPELSSLANVAGQQEMLLSLPPQHYHYKYRPLCLPFSMAVKSFNLTWMDGKLLSPLLLMPII